MVEELEKARWLWEQINEEKKKKREAWGMFPQITGYFYDTGAFSDITYQMKALPLLGHLTFHLEGRVSGGTAREALNLRFLFFFYFTLQLPICTGFIALPYVSTCRHTIADVIYEDQTVRRGSQSPLVLCCSADNTV